VRGSASAAIPAGLPDGDARHDGRSVAELLVASDFDLWWPFWCEGPNLRQPEARRARARKL